MWTQFQRNSNKSLPSTYLELNRCDRHHAEQDFKTNVEAKKEIEQLLKKLNSIEIDKLDKILELLQEKEVKQK